MQHRSHQFVQTIPAWCMRLESMDQLAGMYCVTVVEDRKQASLYIFGGFDGRTRFQAKEITELFESRFSCVSC